MDYIFSQWDKIVAAIKKAEHVLLVLDYDGVLTSIAESPDSASLKDDTRRKLEYLTGDSHFTLGVMSGRSLIDVKKRVALKNIYYTGNYGLEIETPKMKFISSQAKELKPLMFLIKNKLSEKMEHIKGILIEDKDLAISVHFRRIRNDKMENVKEIFYDTLGALLNEGMIKVIEGKKAWEVLPLLPLDRGKALRWMLRNLSFSHLKVLPIYAGDDSTDESAFEVVNKRNGFSIFVGKLIVLRALIII